MPLKAKREINNDVDNKAKKEEKRDDKKKEEVTYQKIVKDKNGNITVNQIKRIPSRKITGDPFMLNHSLAYLYHKNDTNKTATRPSGPVPSKKQLREKSKVILEKLGAISS